MLRSCTKLSDLMFYAAIKIINFNIEILVFLLYKANYLIISYFLLILLNFASFYVAKSISELDLLV